MSERQQRKGGRPPAGVHPGEKSSEYQKLTMRLPDDSLALLRAIARAIDAPAWRVIVNALRAYQGDEPVLSESDQRLVRGILRRGK